jgi:hypothetical protein
MKNQMMNVRFGTLCVIILAAGVLRLIPQPQNFAPIGAMALFGGAYFGKRWQSFLIPLAALFVSDIVVNFAFYQHFVLFHELAIWVYGSFALMVIIGSMVIKKVKLSTVVTSNILAAVLFFVVTNFGVWATPNIMNVYPHNAAGLTACYIAAIPYFWGTLFGNLFYSAILFGIFEFAQKRFPALAVK